MAFQHILVPIDGSETAYAAVDQAVQLAKTFNGKITVVQVMTLDPYIAAEYITAAQTNDLIERARTSIQATLEEAKAKFSAEGLQVEARLLEGQVIHREIARAATEMNADLIVMGSHGRKGFQKFLLGSFAQDVLRGTQLPVLIVKE